MEQTDRTSIFEDAMRLEGVEPDFEPAPGPIWTNGLDETGAPALPPCPAWCPIGPQGAHSSDVRIHAFDVLSDVAEDAEGVEVPVHVVLERSDLRAKSGQYEAGLTQVRLEVGHAWNQPLEIVLSRQLRVRVAAALLTATSLEAAE